VTTDLPTEMQYHYQTINYTTSHGQLVTHHITRSTSHTATLTGQ